MFFKKFFEWFRKNTKNKIIVFSIVFIFALGYSFLHRPLGLIIWDSFYFSKENEQIKMITNYMDDEEKFLKTYKQYHIANKFEKTQEELFKYIDDFEIDLLASSFIGLSDLYLQAFLQKNRIYVNSFNLYTAYQEYHKNLYTPKNTHIFMEFLDKNEKISFFIDKLALKDEEFESYMFQQSLLEMMFIFPYTYFLPQEQICALPDKEKILKSLRRFDDIWEKMKDENKTYKMVKERQGNVFDKNLQRLFNIYDKTKEKFNKCQ